MSTHEESKSTSPTSATASAPVFEEGGWFYQLLWSAIGLVAAWFLIPEAWRDELPLLKPNLSIWAKLLVLSIGAIPWLFQQFRERPSGQCPICQGRKLDRGLNCPNCKSQPAVPRD